MLFEVWNEVVRATPSELALWDLTAGRRWSFRDLAKTVENSEKEAHPIVFPQGNNAEFVLSVLRAWRAGVAVCPLEPDQIPPIINSVPEECKHLKLTSATSGTAKLVALTEAQMAADASNIVQTMGLKSEWPNLGAISLAHSYGFSNLVLPLLLHGIPLILAPSALPDIVRRSATSSKNLTLAGVPALWKAWHDANAIPSNVKMAISAGAPLPLEMERAIYAAHDLKIHNFYGASECGGIAFDASSVPRTQEGIAGRPMNGVTLALDNDRCLQVFSQAVGQTYLPLPDPSLKDGCFKTSDLAEIHDGVLHLRGRIGDTINVAGRKVSPETIEQILRRHPNIKECLVFGVPDPHGVRTDSIVACVVTQTASNSESLRQFLLSYVPAWQIPRDWWFVDSLGTNARGKVSRAEWKKLYCQKRFGH